MMKWKFEPVGQRIIVKKIEEHERHGLLMPKDSQRRALIGEVLHAGSDCEWTEPGDMVVFAQYSGAEPYMNDDLRRTYKNMELLVMNEEDVISRIKKLEVEEEVTA